MLTFDDTDICRVTNNGDFPITLGWNSRTWKIDPGKVAVVPVHAAILAFGDPRAIGNIRSWKSPLTNEVGWVPDRPAEVRRLRVKYGLNDGNDTNMTNASGEVPPNVPLDCDVEFMQGGDFIPVQTVLQDPHGHGAYIEESNEIDVATLKASLEKTQRQLAILMAKQEGDIGLGDEDDIPVDSPTEAVSKKK